YFAWLHLMYPHDPWRGARRPGASPGAFRCDAGRDRRAEILAAYDDEVRRADEAVGRVAKAVDAAGHASDTWIVVVSDHGQAFWEHGLCGHGNSLYDEQLRVVLLVVPPRGTSFTPGRVAMPVSLVDLHPTLLDLAGAPADDVDGRSLLRFLRPGSAERPGLSFAEEPRLTPAQGPPKNPLAATVIDPPWKLLRDPADPAPTPPRLFDVSADPGEHHDLAPARGDVAAHLSDTLRAHVESQTARRRAAAAPRAPAPLSAETRSRLRELGYLR
ncbi:MAG: sulfatase, partial [Alphaproteobacteria bacterium]